MDSKLDKIGKQMEEMKQGLDRKFLSVDVDMRAQKEIEIKNVQLRWRSGLQRYRTYSLLHSNNKVSCKGN